MKNLYINFFLWLVFFDFSLKLSGAGFETEEFYKVIYTLPDFVSWEDVKKKDGSVFKKAIIPFEHDIRKHLLSLIENAEKSIDVAMFTFTDGSIAEALVKAKQRGVRVRVVLDQFSMGQSLGSKGPYLIQQGIEVYPFFPTKIKDDPLLRDRSPIMHNKFVIFEKSSYQGFSGSFLWTGSYNFTNPASVFNYENVVILNNRQIVKKYKDSYEILLKIIPKLKVIKSGLSLETVNAYIEEFKLNSTPSPNALDYTVMNFG